MPVVNLTLDLGRHEQVWGVGRATRGGILDGRSVHVVAATVMFGAIAAVSPLVFFSFGLACSVAVTVVIGGSPLGKAFIASNMSSLARPAPITGFGVAFARRTTARTNHCCISYNSGGSGGGRL